MGRSKFSAGVVIVRWTGEAWRYLLLRVFRTWDFPKGGVEAGESPLQAAIREVEEETGLTTLDFRWGEAFRETVPYSGGKVARYYVAASTEGKVSLPINPELGRPEHHEFRLVSYPEARRLLPERLQPILEWAHGLVTTPAEAQAQLTPERPLS
jgi:bis(5'-nucleosidyl)-tetraphosphatase